MEQVLSEYVEAMTRRSALDGSDIANAVDDICSSVRETGFRLAFQTGPIGWPRGAERCFVKYSADAAPTRWRLVARGAGGDRPSSWRESDLGAGQIYGLPAGKGYGWLPDGSCFARVGWPYESMERFNLAETTTADVDTTSEGDETADDWAVVDST